MTKINSFYSYGSWDLFAKGSRSLTLLLRTFVVCFFTADCAIHTSYFSTATMWVSPEQRAVFHYHMLSSLSSLSLQNHEASDTLLKCGI